MTTESAQLIYKAAIASFINPVYDARQEAEAATVRDTVGLDDEGRPLSPVQRLEKYFGLIDTNSDKKVSAQDLANAWISSVTNPSQNDLELIAREIDRFMKLADLDNDGYVSLNEYVHYMLTMIREKEEGRRSEIHGLIAEKARKDSQVIDKLIEWFLDKDTQGMGEISVDDFRKILDTKVKLKDSKRAEINEILLKQSKISYSQYVMLMLGRTPNKVSLVFYDISSSATKNLSRILFGKKIEGIWHTSILVFGYEWWYGGDCFQSRPFSTPFGTTPTRIEDIGTTTRTVQELKEFVRSKMRKKYNYASYDVISNNCNHFTNDVSHYLVHRGIRKSIVSLPNELLSGGLAKIMRPFLNKWLGNFQSDAVIDDSTDVISKMRQEKTVAATNGNQTFKAGDIAVWKRTESDWIFCEILSMNKDGTVKIKIFRNMKFQIKLLKNKSYLGKISKTELDENEVSINYLIALSILESSKTNSSDQLIMKEINAGLIDGLVSDQSRHRTSTDASIYIGGVLADNSHHISVMAPADGVGLTSDEEDGKEDEQKCCAKFSKILCPSKSS